MVLHTSTPLDQVLKQGYQGKAVELVRTYAHRSVLLKMRAEIEKKLKLTSGPLYMGEAEYLLLLPLCEAIRAANSEKYKACVAGHAYQLAAAYAMIFDISKISQSKDIANQITLNSMTAQPIVQAFMRRTNLSVRKTSKTKNGELEPTDYRSQVADVWRIISTMLTSIVYAPGNDDAKQDTPLMTLYEATSSGLNKNDLTQEDLTSGSVKVWNALLSHLRHGKGTPLDREGRKAYMAMMSEILLRIDEMIEDAKLDVNVDIKEVEKDLLKDDKRSVATRTSFVDAYTAMYWLQLYLKVIDQYDVIFPSTDLLVQSQAWVLIIKTQAAKFKKVYLDIAQVALSFDLRNAMRMWDEVRAFYDPILNRTLASVSDMDSVWNECKAKADKLLSSYAVAQVDQMISSFKAYMKADFLLPEDEFQSASDIVSQFEYPQEVDGCYPTPSGRDVLLNTEAVGERMLSVVDRDLLVPGMAKCASTVETALAYVKRSREILQLSEETDDIYHALLPEGIQWVDPYALSGDVSMMTPATFDFQDPMQLSYEKYDVSIASEKNIGTLDWKFTKLLMKPFYRIPQLQKFSQDRSNKSRVLWPGMGDLPVGDVITAQYVAQPIPACYTATRNASFVNNDFSAYLTLMSGHSGVTSASRVMFRKLAAVLDKYEGTYSRSILDALSATMFVYRTKGDGKWEPMKPQLPTIYGMPTEAMFEANEIKPSAAMTDVVLKRSVRVSIDSSEGGTVYQFVLHEKMPAPDSFVYIAYPYAKGVYVHVPVLRNVFESKRSAFEKAMKLSFSSDNNSAIFGGYDVADVCTEVGKWGIKQLDDPKFVPTMGWAPFLVNLPHMMCTYQDAEDILLEQEYKKYALLSVRVRYDEVERAVYIGGFQENPVELLDVSDYENATTSADPSPLPKSSIVDVPDTQPDAKEPTRSDAEPAPSPTTMAPEKETLAAKAQQLANITKAPVPDPADPDGRGAVAPSEYGSESKEPVKTKPVDANALAGDPASKAPAAEAEDSRSNERYWKKISSSGDIEDVVKAVECPSGYVPASEDEYRKFVTSAAATEGKDA